MKKQFIYLFIILFSQISCISKNEIENSVEEYIAIYQQRDDFESFLKLYDDHIILEDMISGNHLEGKLALKEFFNWSNQKFKKLNDKTFIVNDLIINNNTAVINGYFTPFAWDSIRVEAMQFTTILRFNDEWKIINHTDWINYPNYIIDYAERSNSNDWLK